jgi:hypothetical protein
MRHFSIALICAALLGACDFLGSDDASPWEFTMAGELSTLDTIAVVEGLAGYRLQIDSAEFHHFKKGFASKKHPNGTRYGDSVTFCKLGIWTGMSATHKGHESYWRDNHPINELEFPETQEILLRSVYTPTDSAFTHYRLEIDCTP